MAKLTKKDFIKRAKLIKSFRSPHVKRKLIKSSIAEFKKANPRFNEKIFREFIRRK